MMYNQLGGMHKSMQGFTEDIEKRLDKLYKNGASQKFGLDDVLSYNADDYIVQEGVDQEETKKLNKIQKDAKKFMDKLQKMEGPEDKYSEKLN